MRHYVLTRSAYGPAWDEAANRRRLAVTAGVTVASMRAQTDRDWTWLVALDVMDPLADERRAAFEAAGVPVRFLVVSTDTSERDVAAARAYRAPWGDALGSRREPVAMTRLDDDDALAPWVMARLRIAAGHVTDRTALMLPLGIRVWRGCYTLVRHESNAMHTLVTPAGDTATVYDYKHRQVRKHAHVRRVDPRVAWVWSRHPDTISGWRQSERPLTPAMRAMFPVDWSLFGESHRERQRGGAFFR